MGRRKVVDYDIIGGTNLERFMRDVKEMVQEGWELHSSLVVAPWGEMTAYYREMVKYEEEDKTDGA